MPGFLNSSQISMMTGLFMRHFNQFSSEIGNTITVFKEPTKVINNSSSLSLVGYTEDSINEEDITYIENYRLIPAMIMYPADEPSLSFPAIKGNLDLNEVMIKVDEEGALYIDTGKTEKVIINDKTYNINDTNWVQNYFGLKFYYYKCVFTR